ncbi:MAG TPA: hypothetical protein VG498_19125 [Terriglobales bacterium]|nr:hypothetical protein [Terriglobales bacterium]
MDAHNCYPYYEWWEDRIDRALATGTPLAIEQDPYWYVDPSTGQGRSVVAHGAPVTGHEPTLEDYFFERIRPIMETALRRGNRGEWPLITLNLDFKTEQPDHLAAVLRLLVKYRAWITSAPRTSDGNKVEPLELKPLLVLTGESDPQQALFYDQVPIGERLLVFGAVHTHTHDPMAAPEVLEPERASNYRRWWNNPWSVVERGGQTQAGDWTREDELRLRALVEHAHSNGLWIRFYTLDGATKEELSCNGWFRSYNFGSLTAVKQRWQAAARTGVDYIASDQYERLASFLASLGGKMPGSYPINLTLRRQYGNSNSAASARCSD